MSETRVPYPGAAIPPADRSGLLPTDDFSLTFEALTGHPNGAHTQPTVLKLTHFYGTTVDFIVQTVRWEEGDTIFLTEVTSGGTARRFVIPAKVMATIDRQRASLLKTVRRRHGRRLAAERKAAGLPPAFAKNPGKGRRARRAKKGGTR